MALREEREGLDQEALDWGRFQPSGFEGSLVFLLPPDVRGEGTGYGAYPEETC